MQQLSLPATFGFKKLSNKNVRLQCIDKFHSTFLRLDTRDLANKFTFFSPPENMSNITL